MTPSTMALSWGMIAAASLRAFSANISFSMTEDCIEEPVPAWVPALGLADWPARLLREGWRAGWRLSGSGGAALSVPTGYLPFLPSLPALLGVERSLLLIPLDLAAFAKPPRLAMIYLPLFTFTANRDLAPTLPLECWWDRAKDIGLLPAFLAIRVREPTVPLAFILATALPIHFSAIQD